MNPTKSADPGLHQGRGGAWDHRRCGACFCWLATTLSRSPAPTMPKTLCGRFDPALKPLRSVVKGLQACRLPAVRPLPSVVKGVQACRLPALKHLKPLKPSVAASTRHSSHCPLLLKPSNLPFASPQTPKTPTMLRCIFDPALRPLPSVVKGLQACRLPAVRPLPSVVKGVQACRLPALERLKPLKPSAAASARHSGHCPLLLRAFKPAVCQPSGHCPLFLRAFKPAVCQPSGHCPLFLRAFKPAVLPAPKRLKPLKLPRQLRPGTQATALCC